jgi:Exostosin family
LQMTPGAKRVLLTTAYAPGRALKTLRRAAAIDCIGQHTLIDDPSAADVIIFVENAHYVDDPYYKRLRRHPLVRKFREKTFMYNETDRPWCVLPGLYCSMPRRSFDDSRQRAFCYAYSVNPLIAEYASVEQPDLLFSFLGAPTHAVRRRLYDLRDATAVIENTGEFSVWRALPAREIERHNRRYASVLARSKFVLCPRGVGTSTYRLFEAMEAGRAPVILADQWVEPEGPDWGSFLLRVPEASVADLPEILRGHEPEAKERGARARRAWEDWFAPDVRFNTAVEGCVSILASRYRPERFAAHSPSLEYYRVRTRRSISWLHTRVRRPRNPVTTVPPTDDVTGTC